LYAVTRQQFATRYMLGFGRIAATGRGLTGNGF
jgi:hypothetical protein